MPTPSIGNVWYILTFIDDIMHYTKMFAIPHKSDAFAKFVEFRTFHKKQTGKAIKALRTDGEGEYVNAEMAAYLKTNGILHETTIPYIPQQNGVAERFNRTLIESTRAIMHSASIPDNLWAEIAATATYLRN